MVPRRRPDQSQVAAQTASMEELLAVRYDDWIARFSRASNARA